MSKILTLSDNISLEAKPLEKFITWVNILPNHPRSESVNEIIDGVYYTYRGLYEVFKYGAGIDSMREGEGKASARLCAVLWSDLRFYGMPYERSTEC